MKNIKKLFVTLAMCTAMAVAVTGCGGNAETSAQEDTASETVVETMEETESETSFETDADTDDAAALESSPETVTITAFNAEKEEVEIEVPYNPERVAVMDLAILDMLDNFGFGDRVAGVSKGTSIEYLQEYMDNDAIINLGTIKEASLEAVMECEPEIIFIGGRLASSYEELAEIAPVVYLATDAEIGVVESVKLNSLKIASIFGAEDKVDSLFTDFDSRIEALQAAAEGKTAFVGMLNAGAFNALGNDGRCSLIGVEIGFENVGAEVAVSRGGGESSGGQGGSRGGEASEGESSRGGSESSEEGGSRGESSEGDASTSAHGNETSFEFILEKDPDYIFVMNRDDAIGTEGAEAAQEVIENELVTKTAAYENGNIVYLEYSNVWYTAEGGITALDYMLNDLEKSLLD